MAKREKANYTIQAVAHALDVLEELKAGGHELGVTELSHRLLLHKNNIFRLLATLETAGYVEQNPVTENYHLGLKALELGQAYSSQMGILRQAGPVLESVNEACDETVYLGVLRGREAIYLDVRESNRTVRVVADVGTRMPTHATALGKVHLAALSEEELGRHLPEVLSAHTSQTLTNPDKLRAELLRVKTQGYAVENEEYEEGVRSVAVAIRDYTGAVVAAIGVSGPAERMSEKVIRDRVVPIMLDGGNGLSKRLGYELNTLDQTGT